MKGLFCYERFLAKSNIFNQIQMCEFFKIVINSYLRKFVIFLSDKC